MRARLACLIALCLLATGCPDDTQPTPLDSRIGTLCLGASNTVGIAPTPWCAVLAANAASHGWPWDGFNGGTNGATIADFTSVGFAWMAQTLPDFLATYPQSDVVIITAETNDANSAVLHAQTLLVTPQMVVDQMHTLCDLVTAQNRTCMVTTVNPTPAPGFGPGTAVRSFIDAQNQLIRNTFPAWQIVDFTTGFDDPALYWPNDQHLNQAGQTLRGHRALSALVNIP